jgi:hypothetical protein
VFAGGATIDATQSVTGASPETLEALTAKSLLDRRQTPDGVTRLVMLETVRATAVTYLASDRDRDAVYRRHFQHYLELAEEHSPQLSTHDEPRALVVLDAESDNLTTALRWALDAAPNSALRLAGHLARYWRVRGDQDGLYWLDVALQGAGTDASPRDRALAQLERARCLAMRQRYAESNEAEEEALSLYRQAGDQAGIARACCSRATEAYRLREMEVVASRAEDARRHALAAGDDGLVGGALSLLALAAPSEQRPALLEEACELLMLVGDYRQLAGVYLSAGYEAILDDHLAEALGLLDMARSVLPRVDSPATEMFVLGNVGMARLLSGQPTEARAAFEGQLRLCVGRPFRYGADEGLVGLAAVSATEGQVEHAAILRAAGRAMGYPQRQDVVIDERLENQYFAPARAVYGIAAWRKAERAGARLTYEEAVELELHRSAPS